MCFFNIHELKLEPAETDCSCLSSGPSVQLCKASLATRCRALDLAPRTKWGHGSVTSARDCRKFLAGIWQTLPVPEAPKPETQPLPFLAPSQPVELETGTWRFTSVLALLAPSRWDFKWQQRTFAWSPTFDSSPGGFS